MPLIDDLQKVCEKYLREFRMYEDRVDCDRKWHREHAEFLNFCLRQKHMDLVSVRKIVATRITEIGQMVRQETLKPNGTYADHTSSRHALGFAIHAGVFTPKELSEIMFDHGDTPQTFMRESVKDLVSTIVAQLLAGPPEARMYHEKDTGACADGGPCTCN